MSGSILLSSPTANASDREIVATRLFDAPRQIVFQMWTDPKHIVNWWGPRGFTTTIHEMDVRPGGVWQFVMHGPDGTDYNNKIIYRDVESPELITYSHVSGPVFDVTVTFTEVDDKTSVTMRMLFESAAQRNKVAEEFGAVEGLHQTLDRLVEEVLGDSSFVISRTFDASRDLLFRVWTESEHLQHWFAPKGFSVFHCTNDPRPGGVMHYGMRSEDGTVIWGKWVYHEITPPERLVFVDSFSDEQANVTRHPLASMWPLEILSTVRFTERDGRTTVTVEWVPWTATEEERQAFREGHPSMLEGWTGTLDYLSAYVPTLA